MDSCGHLLLLVSVSQVVPPCNGLSSRERAQFLSFLAMNEDLGLRGASTVAWTATGRRRPAARPPARRARAEPRGARTASYLLGERRYDMTPGTLTWLFPGPGPRARRRVPRTTSCGGRCFARPRDDPGTAEARSRSGGSRAGSSPGRAARLEALLRELHDADDALLNAGLAYLLLSAWQAYLRQRGRRRGHRPPSRGRGRRAPPARGSRCRRTSSPSRARPGSAPHLSRLFKAQTGVSLTRFRTSAASSGSSASMAAGTGRPRSPPRSRPGSELRAVLPRFPRRDRAGAVGGAQGLT